MAAIDLKITVNNIYSQMRVKYPRGEFALRGVGKEGNLQIPIKPYREYPSQGKPVTQYDLDMNPIKTFESMTEAAIVLGVDRESIRRVSLGEYKTCKGFKFRFEANPITQKVG